MLRAFLLTELFELAGMAFFSREKDAFLVCFTVNVLTNIPFNFLLRLLRVFGSAALARAVIFPAEVLIVILEALVYRYVLGWTWKKAAGAALILNLLSFAGGFLLQRLGLL